MRTLILLAAALTLAPTGCKWMEGLKGAVTPARTGPLPERSADLFVSDLNQMAAAVQTIEFDRVSLSAASGPLIQQAFTLEGDLYCAKPRQFRLRAGLKMAAGQLDIGSNDQYFWMYIKQAPDPNFVYCNHQDLATGRAQLPIPFDTEWVLQALGMTTYDPALKYTVEVRNKEREYALICETKTPQGVPVRKITVLAGDRGGSSDPWVKKHVVIDLRSNVTIASAEIKRAKPVSLGTDPQTGLPQTIQIPTEILLTFNGPDNQKMKFEMRLDKETVNAPTDPQKQAYLFTLPKIQGTNPINLADYRVNPTARGQAPTRSRRQ